MTTKPNQSGDTAPIINKAVEKLNSSPDSVSPDWEERWEKFISILIVAIDTDFVGTMLTFYEHDLKAFIRDELSAAREEGEQSIKLTSQEIYQNGFNIGKAEERQRIIKLLEKLSTEYRAIYLDQAIKEIEGNGNQPSGI